VDKSKPLLDKSFELQAHEVRELALRVIVFLKLQGDLKTTSGVSMLRQNVLRELHRVCEFVAPALFVSASV
jgi:hypothetical protein